MNKLYNLRITFGVWLLLIALRIADLELDDDFLFDCDCGGDCN